MKRRDFVAALGGAALWPFRAIAQQGKMRLVGVLVLHDGDAAIDDFLARLRDLGYVQGRNVHFEIRSAGGDVAQLPALAAELIQLKVEVLATRFTPEVLAAKQATSEIPIVMMSAGDPVGMGIIASLAHPGGNITGISAFGDLLAGKTVDILRELLPSVRRIAALCNSADPFGEIFLKNVDLAGRERNVEISPFLVTAGAALDAAFPSMVKDQVDAVIVQGGLASTHTAALALHNRLASASIISAYPRSGGLLAYSADPVDLNRRAAFFVDKILKGAKPFDLPVEQATKFQLSINVQTAKSLGLTVPQLLLARADDVIE
jgi:putative ABC transport system substrate-binding protein